MKKESILIDHSYPPTMGGSEMSSSNEKDLTDCVSDSQLQGSHLACRKVQTEGLLFLFIF